MGRGSDISFGGHVESVCTRDRGSWVEKLPLVEFSYNNIIGWILSRHYRDEVDVHPCVGTKERSILSWTRHDSGATGQICLIQDRMHTAKSRQKSYVDRRRRPLEFDVGNSVFLWVSSIKMNIRYGLKGKLSPRYIGPYEILERIVKVAYRNATEVGECPCVDVAKICIGSTTRLL